MRRAAFLRTTGAFGAGLALGVALPRGAAAAASSFSLNTWVHVRTDGSVRVMLAKSEMGQGVWTGLPMLVAEELDVPLDAVVVAQAPAEPEYFDASGSMATGGSRSMATAWQPLRTAGAAARAMLVAAAAKRWNVAPESCSTRDGVVTSGEHRAAYGQLAAEAAALPVPERVALKDPSAFRVIGHRQRRADLAAKVRGAAEYGIDVRVPGMVFAAVARPPTFGGSVLAVDDAAARALPGVLDVVRIPSGVAVSATNTWAAFRGRDALRVRWKDGVTASTPALFADAERLARGATLVASRRGELPAGAHTIEATYRGPFLAHAAMEPMNATADVGDGVEVWAPTQNQARCRAAAARVAGVPVEKVTLHTTFLGGGFGRRLESDYVEDAVAVSKAIRRPVQVVWTREEDLAHDFYRPMSVNVLRASLDGGRITGWEHRIAQASRTRQQTGKPPRDGVEGTAVNYAAPAIYGLPNVRVLYAEHDHGIPVGPLRAPGANWNAFVVETFIDELAAAAGRDPVTFRLDNLIDPRAQAVLRTAAARAWGKPLPGCEQGLAMCTWGYSVAALIADCVVRGSSVTVKRAVIAADVGTVVEPELVTMQLQGGIAYGIGLASTAKITLTNGRVDQSNFFDYTVLRMPGAPQTIVLLTPSTAPPSGVGELGTPPIAPAMANAVFRATGKRVRTLPLSEAFT